MKIINQNLATEYDDQGSGKVILLLHGWQDNLNTFDHLGSALLKEYRVIRLDLPGFGGSEYPLNTHWNLDNYVLFVENFISKLGLEVYAIIGHSFGGRIIIKGVATGQLKSEKIVLIASAGLISNKLKIKVLKLLTKATSWLLFVPPLVFWRQKIRKYFYSVFKSDYMEAGLLGGAFKRVIAEDLENSAKKIHLPTLLVWGENDLATPVSSGVKFNKLIDKSDLHIIKNAGHFVHQEQADLVAKLILDFLC